MPLTLSFKQKQENCKKGLFLLNSSNMGKLLEKSKPGNTVHNSEM